MCGNALMISMVTGYKNDLFIFAVSTLLYTTDLSEMKNSPVDALVIQSVAYLNREKVLKEEGLFRVPGDVTEIQRLYGRFRSG